MLVGRILRRWRLRSRDDRALVLSRSRRPELGLGGVAISLELDLVEVVVVFGALAVGGFVKGLTGTGLPMLAIPVMTLFLGVERAVIIMSIPGIISNVWLVAEHSSAARQSRDLPVLIGTGLVGTVVGTMLLTTLDGRWLSLGLAALIVTYVVLRLRRPHLTLSPSTSKWLSPPTGLASGGLQGATGVSGPLISTYLHSFGMSPPAYIFSVSVLFGLFSAAQVVTLVALGSYSSTLLVLSALAIIPVAAMLPLGSRLAKNMPAYYFSHIIVVTLLVAAAALVWQALA